MPFSILGLKSSPRAYVLGVFQVVLIALCTTALNVPAQSTAVLTQHNDNFRTGDNLTETSLTVTNVNTNSFGLLYSRPVDDEIYAQPLIMTNVNLPGVGPRNLLIIATVNDTVYAYDADDPTVVAPYWTNSFLLSSNITAVNDADANAAGVCGGSYSDFDNNFGIVGTPVIDPGSGTIFLVARTKEISAGSTNFVQRLHALDSTTGLDINTPVIIEPTFPGMGEGGDGTNLTFDPLLQNQRPALLLVNGIIYIAFASHCDTDPYHGWVLGYDAASLQQVTTFVNTPNGAEGGIWMSGQGPSADTNGNVFLSCGNGTVDSTDYGQSLLKLTNDNSGTLQVAGFFTPRNYAPFDDNDLDLGCTGMLLVPGTSLAVSGTKYGMVFVVNRDNMDGLNRSTRAVPNPVQSWSLGRREIHCSPVTWTCPSGTFMYIWGASGDRLRQYKLGNGKFKAGPVARSDKTSGWPGGMLSVSANGTNAGTGVLWAVTATSYPQGALRAYNAQKVSRELWDSDKLPGDALGSFAKFVPPTVANGKVYVATFDNQVQVYGLR